MTGYSLEGLAPNRSCHCIPHLTEKDRFTQRSGMSSESALQILRPFDGKPFREVAQSELSCIVEEEEPSKPSTRLSADAGLASLAAARNTGGHRRGRGHALAVRCGSPRRGLALRHHRPDPPPWRHDDAKRLSDRVGSDHRRAAQARLRLKRPVDAARGGVDRIEVARIGADEDMAIHDRRLTISRVSRGKSKGPL